MNTWAKMMTALLGGLDNTKGSASGNQALHILDQEIRETATQMKQTQDRATDLLAQQKTHKATSKNLQNEIKEHENFAREALGQANETLAHDIAIKIVELEKELKQEQKLERKKTQIMNTLYTKSNQFEATLKRLKQQVDTIKATENVLRAQETVAQRYINPDNKIRTAIDSLKQLEEHQKDVQITDINTEKEQIAESKEPTLKQKLEQAGITSPEKEAEAILQKIKKTTKS